MRAKAKCERAMIQPASELIHHLFQQRLEKGVILRQRIRAAIVACKHDEAVATDAVSHVCIGRATANGVAAISKLGSDGCDD